MKTKSLTVKCFTYTNYLKIEKRRTETLCLPIKTRWWIVTAFSAHIAQLLVSDVLILQRVIITTRVASGTCKAKL